MSTGTDPGRRAAAARFRRIVCASILVFEALVVVFAVLVAEELTDVPDGRLVAIGGGGAVACLLVAGLLRRRWAYALGWLLQGLLVLSGLAVPTMWFVGGIFAVLWATTLYLARRIERLPGPPA